MAKTTFFVLASGTTPASSGTQIQLFNVLVPVECRETMPERLVMPTESMAPGVEPFVLTPAELARSIGEKTTRSSCGLRQ